MVWSRALRIEEGQGHSCRESLILSPLITEEFIEPLDRLTLDGFHRDGLI